MKLPVDIVVRYLPPDKALCLLTCSTNVSSVVSTGALVACFLKKIRNMMDSNLWNRINDDSIMEQLVFSAGKCAVVGKKYNYWNNEYNYWNNALIFSCAFGYVNLVKRLLEESDANVHYGQNSPLQQACLRGHLQIVKVLLKYGANVHVCDDNALWYAVRHGHIKVVELLLENGANVHAERDIAIRRCIRVGTEQDSVHLAKILLSWGADIHACNEESLRFAVECNRVQVTKFLLENGADVNILRKYVGVENDMATLLNAYR
jgi:ankyrin repeat protein